MARIQVAVTKEQTHRLNALVLVGVLLAFASAVHAEGVAMPQERNFGMALPGEKCRVSPLPKWTEPEKWAWTQICEGKEANFNERLKEKLDPRNPAHDGEWSDERKLSSIFLETILLHEPFRSAIPRQGVRIIGAYFPNFIDLTDASIERPLLLHKSRFRSQVDMNRLKTPTFISLEDSKFDDDLNMDSISTGGSLFMRRTEFDEVILRGAKIGGQLGMEGSTFKGKLDMGSISVGDSLLMPAKEFGEVILRGAEIGGQLGMEGSTFKGKLDMDSISVGGSLFMRRKAEFGEVILRGAKIGGQLEMNESIFRGTLNMNDASVGDNLFMRDVTLYKPASLMFLSVGSTLDMRIAKLKGLDLTGSRVEDELRLGSSNLKNIEWTSYKDENENSHAPKLTLRNASVGALQDTKGIWPDHLEREFEGFIYDRLGGFGASEQEKPDERGSSWFIEWLAKDKSYSPQPYRHLAGVLRAAGHEDMANDILFASRDLELGETDWWPPKWVWLWILKLVIGYGYGWGYFRALVWSAVLVGIGTFILKKEGDKDGIKLGFWYSLDMLLPIIQLRERHYTVDLDNKCARHYFYVHKILGYALISFVFAGLLGLVE